MSIVYPWNHTQPTHRFIFELPNNEASLLPVASRLVVKSSDPEALKDDKGNPIVRPYTPISDPHEKGELTLLIKKYETGNVSKHIHGLKVCLFPGLFRRPNSTNLCRRVIPFLSRDRFRNSLGQVSANRFSFLQDLMLCSEWIRRGCTHWRWKWNVRNSPLHLCYIQLTLSFQHSSLPNPHPRPNEQIQPYQIHLIIRQRHRSRHSPQIRIRCSQETISY